jgi:hypothetical protein
VTAAVLGAVPVLNDGNGHLYEAVAADPTTGINWDGARAAAEGMSEGGCQGYLVSITTEAENDFVTSDLGEVVPLIGNGYWIGAHQPTGDGTEDPGVGWEWVSGDAFGAFTDWADGQPDDTGVHGHEDAAHFTSVSTGGFGGSDVKWDDLNKAETAMGYVVEFDGECVLADLLAAQIDIKPGSDEGPPPINLKSQGKIAVAVLSVDGVFDATTIDPATVTLGDGADPDTPVAENKHGKLMASWEDLTGDGLDDAIFHFRTQELVDNNDLHPATTELLLQGDTAGGDTFSGTDAVRVF